MLKSLSSKYVDVNAQECITQVGLMRDLMDSESEQRLLSPTAFIVGLDGAGDQFYSSMDEEKDRSELLTIKYGRSSIEDGTRGSERTQKKRLAGVKSREKKKVYLQGLEQSVKALTAEIEAHDLEISRCKDRLVQAIKTSPNTGGQHAFTFAQLERNIKLEDPDLDTINLLLDLIQNRIGANGRQRQSKLEYNFKQIINSLFPASHRYFMHSALNKLDFFMDNPTPQLLMSGGPDRWTKNLFQDLNLEQNQIDMIAKLKGPYYQKRKDTVRLIQKLKETKQQLKKQEQIFERTMSNIRQDVNPVQSAQLILFGQRNKLRRQFTLFCDEFAEERPRKILKKQ